MTTCPGGRSLCSWHSPWAWHISLLRRALYLRTCFVFRVARRRRLDPLYEPTRRDLSNMAAARRKLTDYKVRMTRFDGVGLKFKDPCKQMLARRWCEDKWEERMDTMLEIGPCPAVMDLEFTDANMLATGFMPVLEAAHV